MILFFQRASFFGAIGAVQQALFELEEKGRLKLSSAIRLSAEELGMDGLKNLGVFHVRKPLYVNGDGDIESQDFPTLYYYHNRLENFGLAKRVDWGAYSVGLKSV